MTVKIEWNQERWKCVWWGWAVDCHLNGLIRSALLRSLLLHQYLNEVKEWTKEISWIRTFRQRKQSVLMSWDESVPDACKMQWGGQCGWEGVRGEGNGDQMSLIIEWLLHARHHWELLASSSVRVIWIHLLIEKWRFSESGWLVHGYRARKSGALAPEPRPLLNTLLPSLRVFLLWVSSPCLQRLSCSGPAFLAVSGTGSGDRGGALGSLRLESHLLSPSRLLLCTPSFRPSFLTTLKSMTISSSLSLWHSVDNWYIISWKRKHKSCILL